VPVVGRDVIALAGVLVDGPGRRRGAKPVRQKKLLLQPVGVGMGLVEWQHDVVQRV
jgi:hypothetical protein